MKKVVYMILIALTSCGATTETANLEKRVANTQNGIEKLVSQVEEKSISNAKYRHDVYFAISKYRELATNAYKSDTDLNHIKNNMFVAMSNQLYLNAVKIDDMLVQIETLKQIHGIGEVIPPLEELKAFPDAVGAGKNATGGRGGIVVKVTTLADSGAGSLREALMMTVPRMIVFEVSGNIVLDPNNRIELILENSNFTVYGQSAPEGGITITNNIFRLGGGWGRASEPCNNAIFRYIRFRNARYDGSSDNPNHNGILSPGTVGTILDHCSFSFNDDQAVGFSGHYGNLTDITIQNCIFSENATGIIMGHDEPYQQGRISFINNLFIDQTHRTPNISGELQYDVINNVMYNWNSRLSTVNINSPNINYIGNHLTEGDHTHTGATNQVQVSTGTLPIIYTANNYHNTYYTSPQLDDRDLWQLFVNVGSVPSARFTTTIHPILGDYIPTTALQARINVLADVGANKYTNADGSFGTYIDSYDTLKIANATNFVSTNPYNKSWTLPTLPNNTRAGSYDTDNDGMADTWEIATFGDLSHKSNEIEPGHVYTNIERFLK